MGDLSGRVQSPRLHDAAKMVRTRVPMKARAEMNMDMRRVFEV